MTDLKVGIIAYALERAHGGIGRYTRELSEALYEQGVDLYLLQSGSTRLPGKVINLTGARLLPALLSIGQVEIAIAAQINRLELVHDPTGSLPILLTKAHRVATIHDAIPYVYPHTSTLLDWLIYQVWIPLAIRRVEMVITDSEQSRQDLLKTLHLNPRKVVVIAPAVNARFKPLDPPDYQSHLDRMGIKQPYILYVGSIEPRKNLLRLLEAYAKLRQWSQKWSLVIVGARNLWKSTRLTGTIDRLKLQPFVHITGFVPDEFLPAVYNGAALFVFPSLYEGFGFPVLEAMACGTPVITSNNSSLVELAGDAARLVEPSNVEDIYTAMKQILNSPEQASYYRQRGLLRANQYSWEKTAQETIKVYKKVITKINDSHG